MLSETRGFLDRPTSPFSLSRFDAAASGLLGHSPRGGDPWDGWGRTRAVAAAREDNPYSLDHLTPVPGRIAPDPEPRLPADFAVLVEHDREHQNRPRYGLGHHPLLEPARVYPELHRRAMRRTGPNWELIVVNNGSTDPTADYLAGVQDASAVPVTVITNATNRGFPAAINQGLHYARGEYLVMLNNDVVVTDGG